MVRPAFQNGGKMLEKLNADLESAYGAMDDAVRAEDYASASAWEDRIQDLRMRRLLRAGIPQRRERFFVNLS